jgi:hypothetical protein
VRSQQLGNKVVLRVFFVNGKAWSLEESRNLTDGGRIAGCAECWMAVIVA